MVDLPPWKILYSQIGSSSQLGRGKHKNVPNHQPVLQRNPVCLVCLELAELRCTCVRNLTARTSTMQQSGFKQAKASGIWENPSSPNPKRSRSHEAMVSQIQKFTWFFSVFSHSLQPFSWVFSYGFPNLSHVLNVLHPVLQSWHQIRKCLRHCAQVLLTRAHRFCWCAYLFLRGAYAGLHGPQFCLHHTPYKGPLA